MNYSNNPLNNRSFGQNNEEDTLGSKVLDATPYIATAIVLGSLALSKNKGINLKEVFKEGLSAIPRVISSEIGKTHKAWGLTVKSLKNAFKRYNTSGDSARRVEDELRRAQDELRRSEDILGRASQGQSYRRQYVPPTEDEVRRAREVVSGQLPGQSSGQPHTGSTPPPPKMTLKDIATMALIGAAPIASSLALSSAADEYFKHKDHKEIREKLRTFNKNMPRLTPDQRIKMMNDRLGGSFDELDKNAASDAGTWREAINKDLIGSFRKSLMLTTLPAVVGTVINKNIKDNFSPIRSVDQGSSDSDKIIIDVPISDLKKNKKFTKVAKFNTESVKEVFRKIKAAAPGKLKEEGFNTAKDIMSTVGWVIPPALVTSLTGRNMAKGDMRKIKDIQKEDMPIAPGTARITIQTNTGNKGHNNYDMMMTGRR